MLNTDKVNNFINYIARGLNEEFKNLIDSNDKVLSEICNCKESINKDYLSAIILKYIMKNNLETLANGIFNESKNVDSIVSISDKIDNKFKNKFEEKITLIMVACMFIGDYKNPIYCLKINFLDKSNFLHHALEIIKVSLK